MGTLKGRNGDQAVQCISISEEASLPHALALQS
jgi:hypothetical protein